MTVKFGDVVLDTKGKVDRNDNPYDYYIAGDHMNSEDLEIHRKGCFATDDVGPAFIRTFVPGQVLYGSRRTYLKKVAVADFEGVTANTTFVFQTKDESVFLQRLLPFVMLSDKFTKWSVQKSKGSTNPYVLFSDLADFEFELPDMEKQEELAELLWSMEYTKRAYRRLIQETDELVKSQFIEMFGVPLKSEKGWPLSTLGEACKYLSDGSHYSPPEDANGKYPMLTVKDMTPYGFNYSECKYISENEYKKMLANGCKPFLNDVLVAKDGSFFKTAFVIEEEIEQAVLSSIAILRPNQKVLVSRFLSDYLLSDEVISTVSREYVTGTAIRRVILKKLKTMPVYLPPLELQNRYVLLAKQSDKSKFELQKNLDELTAMQKKIIEQNLT